MAQAIHKNSNTTSTEYSTNSITNYALARMFSRLVQLKGGLNETTICTVLGSLEAVKQEFSRKVAGTYLDRQRNLNGEVFSELL